MTRNGAWRGAWRAWSWGVASDAGSVDVGVARGRTGGNHPPNRARFMSRFVLASADHVGRAKRSQSFPLKSYGLSPISLCDVKGPVGSDVTLFDIVNAKRLGKGMVLFRSLAIGVNRNGKT
jgi:hypothetical protein